MELEKKIELLAQAAQYDVSCSSSGSTRLNQPGGTGNAHSAGICHTWSDDGRCISLLKILYTNACIYDCAYCVNRRSQDTPRTRFTVDEITGLVMQFYRRNYIEGLFLSSGIIRSPDYTMEKLNRIIRILRREYRFNGYIHVKAIPGASPDLIREAGSYADRLSVNIEIPSVEHLKRIAPDKKTEDILKPMHQIGKAWHEYRQMHHNDRRTPPFVPAGQSTQLVIGVTPETDYQILKLSSNLYRDFHLKRVYYSAYVPVPGADSRLPMVSAPPLRRENRLYQADWLMRFYHFQADEILDPLHPDLEDDFDPKMVWALKHLDFFPVDVNRADYRTLLRVPGIGVRSAQKILHSRRFRTLDREDLKRIGISLKRARFFITCRGSIRPESGLNEKLIRSRYLLDESCSRDGQLLLFQQE
jgi:putative DNA modification/repair radical SAM protein